MAIYMGMIMRYYTSLAKKKLSDIGKLVLIKFIYVIPFLQRETVAQKVQTRVELFRGQEASMSAIKDYNSLNGSIQSLGCCVTMII